METSIKHDLLLILKAWLQMHRSRVDHRAGSWKQYVVFLPTLHVYHTGRNKQKTHSFARIFTWLEWRQGRFAALRATHTFRIVLEQMRVGKE